MTCIEQQAKSLKKINKREKKLVRLRNCYTNVHEKRTTHIQINKYTCVNIFKK